MDNKRPGLRGVRAGCLTVQFSVIGWFLVLSLVTGNQNDRRANQQQATNDVEDRGTDDTLGWSILNLTSRIWFNT